MEWILYILLGALSLRLILMMVKVVVYNSVVKAMNDYLAALTENIGG